MSIVTWFLGLTGMVMMLIIAAAVGCYVLTALGIHYVLCRLKFAYPFLAWIPVANIFALAMATADSKGDCYLLNIRMPAPVFALIVVVCMYGSLGFDSAIVSTILTCITAGRMYQVVYARIEGVSEADTAVLGYLSGVISLIATIKLFMYRVNGLRGPWS